MYRRSLALAIAVSAACVPALSVRTLISDVAAASGGTGSGSGPARVLSVSGTGVHFFRSSIVHSKETTPTGTRQTSTETVDLTGDLTGRVLYQPVTVIDSAKGTLVNTGRQVFSGTVLGLDPVILYDDTFRFEVDLKAGVEKGEVHFTNAIAGPKVRCDLAISGTGKKTADGDPVVAYTGTCTGEM